MSANSEPPKADKNIEPSRASDFMLPGPITFNNNNFDPFGSNIINNNNAFGFAAVSNFLNNNNNHPPMFNFNNFGFSNVVNNNNPNNNNGGSSFSSFVSNTNVADSTGFQHSSTVISNGGPSVSTISTETRPIYVKAQNGEKVIIGYQYFSNGKLIEQKLLPNYLDILAPGHSNSAHAKNTSREQTSQ